jgi:hypothetical protein
METIVEIKTDLFMITFLIGGDKPGMPVFRANFSVYIPGEALTGVGNIIQSSIPPTNIPTNLDGQFTYMSVMPNCYHIVITAIGKAIIKWPHGEGIGQAIPTNVDLKMVISEDWKTGTANYKYMNNAGKWSEVSNAPVKALISEIN